jgi:superfamily I DNA/RNA helicase/mRNA-degrading endonuclease RelE of RelBE toxin-antitoxin system
MEFRIADTFTDSLARLTGDEQKAVKTTAFDLQMNPANPGMQFHKLDRAKDKRFASVRVNADIRLIVHRGDDGLLLCYVDHHDKAYTWAERRKIERHPKTGAAQLVEIRETVREVEVPLFVPASPMQQVAQKKLFDQLSDDALLGYGVPTEWLEEVKAATEDTLLELVDHLPREASEALLDLATGATPKQPVHAAADADPFTHPDAQRRFRVMTNVEELERALEFPWEKWTIFLHPAQRDLVERRFNGPARASGSAGTGKTIVAIHRAAHLARANRPARVLLTTFSGTLCRFLNQKLSRLVRGEPSVFERIDVRPLAEVAAAVYTNAFGRPTIVDSKTLVECIALAGEQVPEHRFSQRFLIDEWNGIVDAWQVDTWEKYRTVPRLGRKTRLSEQQRRTLWDIFEKVRATLAARGLITDPQLYAKAVEAMRSRGSQYEHVVVDECQDISVAQLRFLGAIAPSTPDAIFFAGDLGQRIFQAPFSWKSLGVDIRGRSHTLRINYRTSHQIRRQADRLLPREIADVDGITECRSGTVSVFNGPHPEVREFTSAAVERGAVAEWIKARLGDGLVPAEIGVFVRSEDEMARSIAAIEAAGLKPAVLDAEHEQPRDTVATSTMHLAKGLEFRAVVVMAADEDVIPLGSRIEAVADEADLEEVYNTERHLLYVACTRARDHLLVCGVDPVSEFLDDLALPSK